MRRRRASFARLITFTTPAIMPALQADTASAAAAVGYSRSAKMAIPIPVGTPLCDGAAIMLFVRRRGHKV